MLDVIILILSILSTIIYLVVVPVFLKNKNIEIPGNQFQEFVNNDSGYAWSLSKERKKQYRESLNKRLKISQKQ